MPTDHRPISVAALCRMIQNRFADMGSLQVIGELAQVRIAASGHCYATLKEADATIGLVIWRSTLARLQHRPVEGEQVVVGGHLSLYAPRGNFQLVVRSLSPSGRGDLAQRFEALKARLSAEGLFAEEGKQELPVFPTSVGLATASGSAALADLVHSLRTRLPGIPIVHAPCAVQGAGAAAQIADAIAALDRDPRVQVIIAGRGGGSLEDLWAFNEEAVVRAIAACRTPLISAVGHETDTTLADLAADVRAKTPTAAAELAVPAGADWHWHLIRSGQRLRQVMQGRLQEAHGRMRYLLHHRGWVATHQRLDHACSRCDDLHRRLVTAAAHQHETAQRRLERLGQALAHRHPAARIADWKHRHTRATHGLRHLHPSKRLRQTARDLDELERRLRRAAHQHHALHTQRLGAAAARLDALSPLKVLARGYAVLRDADGRVIADQDAVAVGDRLQAILAQGRLTVRVEDRTP